MSDIIFAGQGVKFTCPIDRPIPRSVEAQRHNPSPACVITQSPPLGSPYRALIPEVRETEVRKFERLFSLTNCRTRSSVLANVRVLQLFWFRSLVSCAGHRLRIWIGRKAD